MSGLREAAEMALEFVDWLCGDDHSVKPKNKALDVREALREALAQPDEVLAEREECAKLCDEMPLRSFPSRASDCAAAIRARGEK